MAQHDDQRRGRGSPYSRTGLFPWGNTYDVPAQVEPSGHTSQTPCHLRTVLLPVTGQQRMPCPACGREWQVRVHDDATPPVARWTA